MTPGIALIDARDAFAREIGRMCVESVGGGTRWTESELHLFAAEVAPLFDVCWADFMQWVDHGDDERAKTREVIRTSLRVASMWDSKNWR